MITVIAAILSGFVAHQNRALVSRNTSSVGWQCLIRYTIGTLIILVFGGAIYHQVTGRSAWEFYFSGLASACAVGSGVGAGWLLYGDVK